MPVIPAGTTTPKKGKPTTMARTPITAATSVDSTVASTTAELVSPVSEYERFKAAMSAAPVATTDKVHSFMLRYATDMGIDYESLTSGKKAQLKKVAKAAYKTLSPAESK